MGNLTYDKFVRSFDTYTEHEECICEKALNILRDCKISNKYKLILPLYRRFSISNNAILLHNYIEDPLWLYDTTDHDMMDRVRIHTRLKKGITDAYCKSHFGTSVLIMERGRQSNSISISIEKDDCYKMALTTDNSNSKKLTPAIDDGLKVSNKLKTLQDLTLDKVIVLNQSSLSINDTEFENGIKAHFPLVENGKFVVYYFFPNNIQTKPTQRYGYGGIFVVSEHYLSKDEKSFFLNVAFLLGNRLAIKSFQQRIKAEAIKSAKAAIMSRNMSHNLGSHVMFYIKQKLQSVSKIVGSNVLHNIIPGNLSDINEIQKKVEANTEIELPFLVGLGRFINYLQERQDYIATVATDYIPAKSAISFKDFIYDELKPDLRYKRHHPNGKTDDAGWQPGNLLLDYIAYSEGYRTSDDIVIRFGAFDGRNPIGTTANTDFQKLRKFNIAVPGGVIGRQAIFSIVENIIRNAAKHSEHRSDGKLVLEMSLVTAEDIEKWGKDFRCKRQKNSNEESGAELARLYKEEKNKNKFHYLRIKVDMPNKSGDIESLVENLASPYIEEGGKMKESSKGLKEMRISAAWLRGYSIDTDIPQYEPPVLAVYSEKYGNDPKKESLSYILCIPRPCRVAFVVEKEYDNAKGEQSSYINLNEALQPLGCVVFEYDNTEKKLSKNELDEKGEIKLYDISEIADYELVCMLLGDNEKTEKVNNILPYISSRHITTKETTKKILDVLGEASDKKSAIDSIYEYWFEDKHPNEKKQLLIVDDNAYEKHQKQSEGNEEKASSTITDVECHAVGTADEENCRDAVIYSTHFAGLYKENIGKKDDNKTKSGYEKLQLGYCIESITGNNSTDRLIRQDEWTTEWKYKHLSAGLARVAVFDERIFGSFITSSNEEYTIERKDIFDTIKKHEETPMSEDDFVAAMKSIGLTEDDSYDILEDMSDQNINEILSRYSAIEYNGCVAQKNYERRIWAFNIQADECYPNTMNIMGYDAKIKANPDWADENIKKPPIKVATLTVDNGEYKVELSEDGKRIFPEDTSKIFDYITIHQGVLDKIYNVFDIKENIKKNIEEKHKVTNALHRCFSKCTTPEKAEGFLPNFIIHSGRSKPNEQDMPQHQPFVQFAAVDHAIKDCKYTLVELLATAHYEKGGNNN